MNRRVFLKFAGVTALCGSLPGFANAASSKRPPNVIFILGDDLGWSELGCYGNQFNETPNLDKLAKQGMLFTDAYAAAPVCSPYRAALMTGRYPARVGVTDYLRPDTDWHLPKDALVLPELFQKGGYRTGMIGKWHLSGYDKDGVKFGPSEYGFDDVRISEQTGIAGGSYNHPYNRVNPEIEPVLGDEYLTDRVNYEAVEFIEQNAAKPFFLYKSHYSVHTVLKGKPELVEYFKAKEGASDPIVSGNYSAENPPRHKNNPVLAAMLKTIDDGVGMIMRKLESLGIADNTIIVFTSDNGGEDWVTNNEPLRAGKSTLYEGGIRVPLIVRYPGVTESGSKCSVPTMNTDFYPTFAQIPGMREVANHKKDGKSILPLLKGKSISERPLFWHYPLKQPHFLGGKSSGAVRLGNWKLIEFFDNPKVELYNLEDDISEENNLADDFPGKVKHLHKLLMEWREDVSAEIPKGQSYPEVS